MSTAKRRCSLSILLLIALITGCTQMNQINLTDDQMPSIGHWSLVNVYENFEDVSDNYREIAILEIKTAVSKKKLLRDCQRRAADLGANGIVLEQLGKHSDFTMIVAGSVIFPLVDERWDGRVIVIQVI